MPTMSRAVWHSAHPRHTTPSPYCSPLRFMPACSGIGNPQPHQFWAKNAPYVGIPGPETEFHRVPMESFRQGCADFGKTPHRNGIVQQGLRTLTVPTLGVPAPIRQRSHSPTTSGASVPPGKALARQVRSAVRGRQSPTRPTQMRPQARAGAGCPGVGAQPPRRQPRLVVLPQLGLQPRLALQPRPAPQPFRGGLMVEDSQAAAASVQSRASMVAGLRQAGGWAGGSRGPPGLGTWC